MTKLDIVSQIADMKEIDYKNTLAIASIIEVLIEKGVIDRNDIAQKANALESMTAEEIREMQLSEKIKNERLNKRW